VAKQAKEVAERRRGVPGWRAFVGLLRKVRALPGRAIGRIPWLRRRYARFLLRSLKKQKAKGRALPESLAKLERQVRGLPPAKQADLLEKILEAGATWQPETAGRALRRASSKQDRRSGRGPGARPGLVPGQRRRA
jgi:hypothetical protein